VGVRQRKDISHSTFLNVIILSPSKLVCAQFLGGFLMTNDVRCCLHPNKLKRFLKFWSVYCVKLSYNLQIQVKNYFYGAFTVLVCCCFAWMAIVTIKCINSEHNFRVWDTILGYTSHLWRFSKNVFLCVLQSANGFGTGSGLSKKKKDRTVIIGWDIPLEGFSNLLNMSSSSPPQPQ